MAQTIQQEYVNPNGDKSTIKLREEAINWASTNIQSLDLLTDQKKIGIHYIVSIFMDRLNTIDEKRPVYDELYEHMKPGDVSYSPFFVKEGIKLVIMDKTQKLTDFAEYAHWRGKTVEEVFGYAGDHRLMDDIEGEATRNTCIIKEHRIGKFPIGASNTFYHEFGHFIHMTTLTPEEFAKVEKLYLGAKKRNVFLDDYAAQSVHEYFAQGLEAFVAETKTARDRWGAYTKNDRNDLKRLDPELHDLIAGLIENY